MIILAIANQKGGVGKTTLSVNFSAELAMRGFDTLLIDADPQANATVSLLPEGIVETSLIDVLVGSLKAAPLSLTSATYNTELVGLDIVPATLSLARFEKEQPHAIQRLRSKIRQSNITYDFIVIDLPPSLGFLFSAALIAATHMLVPVSAQFLPLEGVRDLIGTYEEMRESNESLEWLGIVVTMFDVRNNISSATYAKIRETFPNHTFDTIIHDNVKLAEAPAFHRPIQLYAPNSRGAQDHSSMTDEILTKLGMRTSKARLRVVEDAVAEERTVDNSGSDT